MKKMLSFFSLVLIAVLSLTAAAIAGKPFEGVITFKITYPDSKFSESQLAMFPKMFTVSVKGSKARTDLEVSSMKTIEITDYIEKTKTTMIDMMGQKYAIKQTTADIEKEMAKEAVPTVELSPETRAIAGYTCKKAVVTVNNDGVKTIYEVYYTDELGSKIVNFDNPLYKDINGVLLEFRVINHDVTMKFTATSVEKKSMSAKDFDIPSDYKLTTQEELKSKFGGGSE